MIYPTTTTNYLPTELRGPSIVHVAKPAHGMKAVERMTQLRSRRPLMVYRARGRGSVVGKVMGRRPSALGIGTIALAVVQDIEKKSMSSMLDFSGGAGGAGGGRTSASKTHGNSEKKLRRTFSCRRSG